MNLLKNGIIGLLLPAMLPLLLACGGDGAGDSSALNGTWSGSFLEGDTFPSALGDSRFLHSASGSISANLTENGGGTVSGTVTMTPGICAEDIPETTETVTEPVTGTLTSTTLTFSYISQIFLTPQEVIFTAPFPADPILGDYDGSNCNAIWVGKIRLTRQ